MAGNSENFWGGFFKAAGAIAAGAAAFVVCPPLGAAIGSAIAGGGAAVGGSVAAVGLTGVGGAITAGSAAVGGAVSAGGALIGAAGAKIASQGK
ncbi:MAG: hypothetical protein IKI08_00050 [Selenomonadaceae bacterium]|nr:hypothetical protein [Selenomonadaceae bacterium]